MDNSNRNLLKSLFEIAVSAADPMLSVPKNLPAKPKGRVIVIGAGKASARMAEAVEATYGACEGLVITRYGYTRPCQGIEIIEAAHPVPDQAGVDATARMLSLVESLGEDDLVIALISGGGSALLCAPKEGLSFEDKIKVNSALLASGAPIGEMNVLRKHLSNVKGGQLSAKAYPAKLIALMISDVPGDDPALIASGPTVGGDNDRERAIAIRKKYLPEFTYLDAIIMSEGGAVGLDEPRLAHTVNKIIAAPSQSLEAAAQEASKLGFDVEILGDALEGEARDVARIHAKLALEKQRMLKKPLLLISGGELTVTRKGDGVGGPNAEYMLALALMLAEANGIYGMAGDTDGVDGAAEIAGAFIDPSTLSRANTTGLDPQNALEQNDAHRFFESLGDNLITGPTLTNVNDFRALLILPI